MKTIIFKAIRAIFVAILGLLGFAACGDKPEERYQAYGSPTADYKYLGSVTDEAGNPIEGINVVMSGVINATAHSSLTLKTDKYGKFSTVPLSATATRIETIDFVDVDGPDKGGDFQSQTITLQDMKKTQVKEGDNAWYVGEFEYSADVKLKKK